MTTRKTLIRPLIGVVPETGFMRVKQILAVYPVSESHWWAGVRSGLYPAAVKLSGNVTAWRAEDIRALLAAKGAKRGTTGPDR